MKYVLALIVMSFITPIKTKTHIVPADIYIPVVKSYTDSDLNLLARLVYSESPHEIYEGKIAVANVVLHRAQRKNKTIKEIIYQKGQFDGIRSKRFIRVAKGDEKAFYECFKAAYAALNGELIVPSTVEFFFNPDTSTDSKWIKKIIKYKYKKIGRHMFCHRP